MPPRKRKVVKAEERKLVVEGGEVREKIVVPEIAIEVQEEEEQKEKAPAKPRIQYETPNGKVEYEYVGDCFECAHKRPPVITALFKSVSPLEAPEQIGNQAVCYRRAGHEAQMLCKDCLDKWLTTVGAKAPRYKVL